MFAINFNFPYRKKDGSLITMEKALDGAGADLDLIDLDDVAITTPADGDGLIYDNTAQKWKNIPIISRIVALFDAWKKNGAYNLCPNEATTQVVNGVTYTVNVDGTISTSGATTTNTSQLSICNVKLPKGTYKAVGCPIGGSSSPWTYYVIYKKDNASGETLGYDEGNGCTLTLATDTVVNVRIIVNTNIDMSGKVFKPMITTDLNATYDDYQPYAMTNRELTEDVTSLKSALLLKRVVNSADNLNDIKEIGTYAIGTTPTNLPSEAAYSSLMVLPLSTSLTGSSGLMQIVSKQGVIYTRAFTGSPLAWTSWVKFTGTVVS